MKSADCPNESQTHAVSRRGFLACTASAACGTLFASRATGEPNPDLRIRPDRPPSRVAEVRAPMVLGEGKVHPALIREMLAETLLLSTRASTVDAAWRSFLKPDDIIGLKFNRSGQTILGTTDSLADAMVESLLSSGWEPSRIVCIEAPAGLAERHGLSSPRSGFDLRATDFGSGSDQFASVLNQITALISIPFLKTHNIATITCAMKNVSHGLLKHPARYHANGCSPYIADIVAAGPIQSKLRFSLVDALRIVYHGGPEPHAEWIDNSGTLLASTDPVAVDTVGLMRLNATRKKFKLPPAAKYASEIGYLAEAHRRDLGVAAEHGIDVVRKTL